MTHIFPENNIFHIQEPIAHIIDIDDNIYHINDYFHHFVHRNKFKYSKLKSHTSKLTPTCSITTFHKVHMFKQNKSITT
jgi:hypothetical protein